MAALCDKPACRPRTALRIAKVWASEPQGGSAGKDDGEREVVTFAPVPHETAAAGQIYRRGVRLRLPDRSFRVLAALLEHPGQAVTREDLRRRLWPGEVFVDFDNILNTAVARLRDALHDSADRPRLIETLPKRGYRFIASVSEPAAAAGIARPERLRLLVLPFANSSGDAAQEYVSDAMTDEVITELARVAPDWLAVIARTTAMRYKGSRKDVARIGRELQVDYVVEGGVRHACDAVAVNVQLIRARDQTHVWARKYEGRSDDVVGSRNQRSERELQLFLRRQQAPESSCPRPQSRRAS
jgi:TolB-like protein